MNVCAGTGRVNASGIRACAVCGAALPAPSCEPYPACANVACRMVVARRPEMGDMLFKPYLACQLRQRAEQAARNQCMQQQAEREGPENDAGWAAALASAPPDALTGTVQKVVLPSGPHRQVKLSRLRRKRYRVRLQATIAAAFAGRGMAPSQEERAAPAITSRLPGHLCAACGGGCCTSGRDHAYLTVSTIRRYIEQHPEVQPQEVFAAYHGRLTARTQAGSCIHHGANGCTLSRDMRSDICNHYACGQLQALERAQCSGTPVHTVLVVRRKLDRWTDPGPGRDNAIVAHAVLTEAGMRTMSPIVEE